MTMLVPILTYHRVADLSKGTQGWRLAVPPAAFAAQVDWLARGGWQGLALLPHIWIYSCGSRCLRIDFYS